MPTWSPASRQTPRVRGQLRTFDLPLVTYRVREIDCPLITPGDHVITRLLELDSYRSSHADNDNDRRQFLNTLGKTNV